MPHVNVVAAKGSLRPRRVFAAMLILAEMPWPRRLKVAQVPARDPFLPHGV
jgi:hypothetical protein